MSALSPFLSLSLSLLLTPYSFLLTIPKKKNNNAIK